MATTTHSDSQNSAEAKDQSFFDAKFVFILVFLPIVLGRLFFVSLDRSELKSKLSDSEAFRKKHYSQLEYQKTESKKLRKAFEQTEKTAEKFKEQLLNAQAQADRLRQKIEDFEVENEQARKQAQFDQQLELQRSLQTAEAYVENGRFAEASAVIAASLKDRSASSPETAKLRGFWRNSMLRTEVNKWTKSKDQSCVQLLSHPETKTIVGLHVDGQIRVWDSETELLQRVMAIPARSCRRIALSRDGQRIAAIVDGDLIVVWHISGTEKFRFAWPQATQLCFLGDEEIVVASESGRVGLFTALDGRFLRARQAPSNSVVGLGEIPASGRFFVATRSQLIFADSTLAGMRPMSGKTAYAYALNRNAGFVYLAGGEVTWVYSLGDSSLTPLKKGDSLISCYALAYAPQTDRLVCVNRSGLEVFVGSSLKHIGSIAVPMLDRRSMITCLAIGADGDSVFATGPYTGMKRFSLKAMQQVSGQRGHNFRIRQTALSQNGKKLASLDQSGALVISDVATGKTVSKFAGYCHGAVWLNDTQLILNQSFVDQVKVKKTMVTRRRECLVVWDSAFQKILQRVITGRNQSPVDRATAMVLQRAKAGNAERCFVAYQDGRVKLWNIRSKQSELTFQPDHIASISDARVMSLALNSELGHLAVARANGEVQVYDTIQGVEIARHKFSSPAVQVHFDKSGQCLFVGTLSSGIRAWRSGQAPISLAEVESKIRSFAVFGANDEHLATVNHDGRVEHFALDWQSEQLTCRSRREFSAALQCTTVTANDAEMVLIGNRYGGLSCWQLPKSNFVETYDNRFQEFNSLIGFNEKAQLGHFHGGVFIVDEQLSPNTQVVLHGREPLILTYVSGQWQLRHYSESLESWQTLAEGQQTLTLGAFSTDGKKLAICWSEDDEKLISWRKIETEQASNPNPPVSSNQTFIVESSQDIQHLRFCKSGTMLAASTFQNVFLWPDLAVDEPLAIKFLEQVSGIGFIGSTFLVGLYQQGLQLYSIQELGTNAGKDDKEQAAAKVRYELKFEAKQIWDGIFESCHELDDSSALILNQSWQSDLVQLSTENPSKEREYKVLVTESYQPVQFGKPKVYVQYNSQGRAQVLRLNGTSICIKIAVDKSLKLPNTELFMETARRTGWIKNLTGFANVLGDSLPKR